MSADPATAPARRTELPNGFWGVILLICTEGAFLTAMVAAYFYLEFTNSAWPPRGIAAPSVALPICLCAGLVATTIPMHLSVRAARAGRRRLILALVAFATVAQGVYLAFQILDLLDDFAKFTATGTAYGSIYFTLLITDHTHVALGMLGNLWLLAKVRGGLNAYRTTAVRVVAWYWYFVAFITVLFTAAQVSPS